LYGDLLDTSKRLGKVATPAIGSRSMRGSKLSFMKLTLVDKLTDANRIV
jgi:hypothetical protein